MRNLGDLEGGEAFRVFFLVIQDRNASEFGRQIQARKARKRGQQIQARSASECVIVQKRMPNTHSLARRAGLPR